MSKTKSDEIQKLSKQFDAHEENIKSLTLDRMNGGPKEENEPQTKISSKEADKNNDIYLKPERIINAKEKFNERLRDKFNHDKEYVQFIAENKEIIGESIELWTKKYPGQPAEFWKVPVNKPVWGPRYLAQQIKNCFYHRLRMDESRLVGSEGGQKFFGQMVVDNTIQRLDAIPYSNKKSIFMGASNF